MSFEGWKRGASIAVKPSYLWGASKQVLATTGPFRGAYDFDHSNKPNLCLVPGWTCDVGTYHRLTKLLEENFNILPLENFPEGISAILSRLSIDDQVQLLLQTLDNSGHKKVNLLGHSNGGVVAALAQTRDTQELVDKVITMSAPLSGAALVSEIPIVSSWARAVADLHPESDVIRQIQAKAEVSDFFVAQKDELFTATETDFLRGKRHEVDGGHFRYMLGTKKRVIETATDVSRVLLT